ncbi:MAG: tetratricopeptide repeat protein [Bacteroidia bacterium]|nr:tetratricopeptide repeat protein [Bacteroidia bacterium]
MLSPGPILLPALFLSVLILLPCLSVSQTSAPLDSIFQLQNRLPSADFIHTLNEQADVYLNSDPVAAQKLAREAFTLAKKEKLAAEQMEALRIIGTLFFYEGVRDSARNYFFAALEFSDQNSDPVNLALIRTAIAACYQLDLNYEAALQEYEKILELGVSEAREPLMLRNIYHNLAYVHKERGSYQQAISWFEKSLNISIQAKDSFPMISSGNLLGDTYREMKKYKEAMLHLRQALYLANTLKTDHDRVYILNNIGSVFLDQAIYDSAASYFEEGLILAQKTENLLGSAGINYNLGRIAQGKGKYEEALVFFRLSLEIAKKNQLSDRILFSLKELHHTLALMDNFSEAYKVQEEYVQLKDSLAEVEGREKLAWLETKFKIREKDHEKAALVQENRLQLAMLFSSLMALGLMIILAGVLVNRYNSKLKTNQLLESQNHMILEQSESIAQKNFRMEKSLHELNEFAYIVSHNLREPLRRIGSYVSLLDIRYRGALPEDAREFITYAVQGVRDLKEMLDDLLNYVVIEIEDYEISKVNMADILQKAITKLSPDISKAGATVISASPLPFFTSNTHLLEMLFYHLIENSLKFRGENNPQIDISVKPKENGYIFSLKDNGVGIDEMSIPKVFSLFYKGSTTSQYSGTGIGLAICKKIVNLHHGEIWAESMIGKGTTIHFTLYPR